VEGARLALERIAARDLLQLAAADEAEVAQLVQGLGDLPGVLLAARPDRGIGAAQVVGHRVLAQRLVVAAVAVLVEVGQRELAQRAVHGVAPAQEDAVGLGDGAPAAVAAEQRHHVVVVTLRAHVEEQRRLAVHPQRGRGEHRPLDAVRAARAQHLAHRAAGIAVGLEVLLQAEQKSLDLARGIEAAQHGELALGKAEILAPRKPFAGRHGEILTRAPSRVDT